MTFTKAQLWIIATALQYFFDGGHDSNYKTEANNLYIMIKSFLLSDKS